MATTVQMNTRIEKSLKTAGDEVLHRYGYSPSSAVQALWNFVVEQNALPDFMPPKNIDSAKAERLELIRASAGMAVRLFEEKTGIHLDMSALDALSYNELRELAWEERGVFDE